MDIVKNTMCRWQHQLKKGCFYKPRSNYMFTIINCLNLNNRCRDIIGLGGNHENYPISISISSWSSLFQFFSNKPHNHIKFQCIFLSGPSQSKTHHIIFWYLMNFNLANDQHSALEISDLSELTVHFNGTGWNSKQYSHLHNHNLWWVLSYPKSAKAMSHVTM
jgi:hypothetical protein